MSRDDDDDDDGKGGDESNSGSHPREGKAGGDGKRGPETKSGTEGKSGSEGRSGPEEEWPRRSVGKMSGGTRGLGSGRKMRASSGNLRRSQLYRPGEWLGRGASAWALPARSRRCVAVASAGAAVGGR